MASYTVKQIADMLSTNEETVRRWLRSGKLDAKWVSKKSGYVITSSALNKFIKETPKYAGAVTAALASSPIAMSVMVGSLLGGMFALIDNKKNSSVSSADVEEFLKKKIAACDKELNIKKSNLDKLQKEIEAAQQELDKYKYALENLDLKVLASEINNEKK